MFVSSDLLFDGFKREIVKQMTWVNWAQMEVWYANGDYSMKIITENYWALCVQAQRFGDPGLNFQLRQKPDTEAKIETILSQSFPQ